MASYPYIPLLYKICKLDKQINYYLRKINQSIAFETDELEHRFYIKEYYSLT